MSEFFYKMLAYLLIAAVLAVVLKQKSPEYAFVLSVASAVIIAILILKNLISPIREIGNTLESYGIKAEYFKVALKAVGIGYITSFIADSCKEAGQISLASKAELIGKTAIFLLSVPIMLSILDTAVGFIK